MCSSLGAPPLLKGEDAKAYETLLAQVCDGIAPSDAIERMWVRDVVDLTWEIFRWRRVKTELIASAVPIALRKILAPLADAEEHSEWMDVLVKLWISQKPSGIKRVNKLLASASLTFNAVIAEAAKNHLDEIERVERLAAIAEGRRDAFLRELDRRRAFAQALRNKVREVEDVEFKTIEGHAIGKKEKEKNAA
jgi:hypothetical protein